MYTFWEILQSEVCSSLLVRHSTIKVTAITMIIKHHFTMIIIILQSLYNLAESLALILHFSESHYHNKCFKNICLNPTVLSGSILKGKKNHY